MKTLTRVMTLSLLVLTMFFSTTPILADTSESNDFTKSEMVELLDQIIAAETRYGLTGVQVAVTKDGKLIKNSAYGSINNYENIYDADGKSILDEISVIEPKNRVAVTTNTLFDLASNTKMYATVYAVQYLVAHNLVTLDTKIEDIFPAFVNDGVGIQSKEKVTVGHLLRHDAGFVPDPQYHNNNYDQNEGSAPGTNHLFSQDRETTLDMMMKTPLQAEPGSRVLYSDVDFMLLGAVVEEITGKRLDVFVSETFYQPLGLDKITFNPLQNGFNTNQTVSSELHGNTRDGRILFTNGRTKVVSGEVHDEKAYYSMDGISGHAGLFGTAEQIAKLAMVMLNGGNGFFDQATIDEFTTPSPLNDTYGYGWRRQGDNLGYDWAFSEFASKETIGHTGWTGTMTLIDPVNNITLALMTNSRNTPIMGPGANDFYTKNFNTNSYGMVSTLIYQALGLGDDTTAHEFLVDMIRIEYASTSQSTASGRNALRALIDVMELRDDSEANTFITTGEFKSIKDSLIASAEEDMKYLIFEEPEVIDTTELEAILLEAESIDKTLYSETSVKALEDAVEAAKTVLDEGNYTQDTIDTHTQAIRKAIDDLVEVKQLNTDVLVQTIEKAKTYKSDDYTPESFKVLSDAIAEAEALLKQRALDQTTIDNMVIKLNSAIDGLVKKSTEVTPPTTKPLPETGMSDSYLYVIGLGVAAMGLFIKKRTTK